MNWTGLTEDFKELIAFTERQGYDLSLLKSINLTVAGTEGGYCSYPLTKKRAERNKLKNERIGYRITCRLSADTEYPKKVKLYVRPEVTKVGTMTFFSPREDEEVARTRQEHMAWLLGHELFHFLRKTKQVPGQNTQAQANVHGFEFMRKFKEGV